jgi:hypothetical protein
MSIVAMDGFDYYNTTYHLGKRYFGNSLSSVVTYETGRYGGQSVKFAVASYFVPTFAASDTVSFGINYQLQPSTLGGDSVASFWSGATQILTLFSKTDGSLVFVRGTSIGSNVLATTAPGVLFSAGGVWHHLGMELTRHASAGAVKIYVDGVQVASATGINTGATAIDSIRFYGNGSYCDDMYITDTATWLGECRISNLKPTADTAQADSTPSTGTDRFACIDETTVNSDTDYVTLATAGNYDRYAMADLGYTPNIIHAVQTVMVARKDDVATRTIRSKVKSAATTANGATKGCSSSYNAFVDIFSLNPDTGLAWDASSVNAMEVGVEVVV